MVAAASQDKALLHSLELTLANLRAEDQQTWPGLPLVFERSWQQLRHSPDSLAPRTQALLRLGQSIAENIEQDGRCRQREGTEPAYHNRRHVADTLVCMTYLLLALRKRRLAGAGVAHLEALMLAVMAGHDYMHPGGNNAYPAQLETLSIQALEPLLQVSGVARQDREDFCACILSTDPKGVKSLHEAMAGRDFDLQELDWKCVLAQEADIMASTLPRTQEALTQALSIEWADSQPEEAAKLLRPGSRLGFLQHAALFTSPAANDLGLNQVKSEQVDALNRLLALS